MSKKNIFDIIGSIPAAEMLLTVFLVLLLEGVLFFHFMITPRINAASATSADLIARRAALEKHRADKLDEEGLRAKLSSLEAEISEKEKALPPALHNEDISIDVYRFAQANNIDLDAVTFQERQLMDPKDYLSVWLNGGNDNTGHGANGADGAGATVSGADFTSSVSLAAGLNAAGAAFEAAAGAQGGAGHTAAQPGSAAAAQSALTDYGPGGEAGAAGGNTEDGRTMSLQGVQISFRSEFHTAAEFMKQFEEGDRKVRIKSASVSRVQEGDLKGVLNLEYAALSPYAEQLYPGLNEAPSAGGGGKDSLFRKYGGYVEEGADPTIMLLSEDDDIDPDFYLVLKSSTSNETKVSYGVYPRVETELRSNVNNAARAKLTINGDEDQFDYVYELASYQKSESRRLEASGGKLRIKVLSCPKAGDDDNVQILFDVDNNTELPVEITVVNDDVLAPRFHEGIMKGDVSVNIK